MNDNNDNDLIGSDSDNVQNNNNPCGGECKNNGYCDEEKHRCEVYFFSNLLLIQDLIYNFCLLY